MAHISANQALLTALSKHDLLQYLPSPLDSTSSSMSILLQLQCFRGVLSKNDKRLLAEETGPCWETVALHISEITKEYNNTLFKTLESNIRFIQHDTEALVKSTLISQINTTPINNPQKENHTEEKLFTLYPTP